MNSIFSKFHTTHTLAASIVALALYASPAIAQERGFYVELDAGATIAGDQSLGIGTLEDAAKISSSKGHDVGLIAGFDLGRFRFEVEASNRKANASGINVVTGGIPLTSAATATGFGQRPANGSSNADSLMANAMVDFGNENGLEAFVGGGVGIAKIRVRNEASITTPWLNSKDSGFAWQALAGVRHPLNDHIDVGLKYRYFQSSRLELVDRLGRSVRTDFHSHSIMASIGYSFGGKSQ